MRSAGRPWRSRGVSLIEAMVAVSVMGVGTLAVLGVQATLRANSDLSKQRSEAVRIAQEQIEDRRGFADLAGYNGIGAGTDTVTGTNATFTVIREIVDPAAASLHAPRLKSLRVRVTWPDRAGQPQQVQMTSVLHGMPPALAGSMAIPANLGPAQTPGGRHAAIPLEATIVSSGSFAGTSAFAPQPGSDLRWYFNNITGVITSICTAIDTACSDTNARLLSGYVRFATLDVAGADPGEAPTGFAAGDAALLTGLGVEVVFAVPPPPAVPPSPARLTCPTTNDLAGARRYVCAVPVGATGVWSGRANVTGLPAAQLAVGTTPDPAQVDRFRVCRYTPFRDSHPVVPSGMRNDQHPRDYVNVNSPLLNQNFLIRTGAQDCPADGPSPLLNTNTWYHQPDA